MYLDLNRNLTETQIALREQTNQFAAEVLRPAAFQLDKLEAQRPIRAVSNRWIRRSLSERQDESSGRPATPKARGNGTGGHLPLRPRGHMLHARLCRHRAWSR